MKPLLWLHFLPFALEFLYNLPFFLQSGPEKIAFYMELVQTGKIKSTPLLAVLKAIQGYTYFGLSLALILRYRKHLGNSASSIDAAYHRWLLFFIFIVALPILVLLFFVTTKFNDAYTFLILLAGFIGFLISLDVATLTKPELFHAFPHQMLLSTSTEEKKQKYENSKLQEAQK